MHNRGGAGFRQRPGAHPSALYDQNTFLGRVVGRSSGRDVDPPLGGQARLGMDRPASGVRSGDIAEAGWSLGRYMRGSIKQAACKS